MAKVIETSIEYLVPDNKNFNKHTEYGMHILEESICKFGLGRSILIDKNNRIIAGNGVVETASQIDLDKVLVVETMGNTLVAVKRNDIDLDSQKGRELALADNATSKANLSWNEEMIMQCAEQFDFDPEEWGVSMSEPEEEEQEEPKKEIDTRLIVKSGDITKLSLLFSELQDRGFKCELKE